MRHSAVCRKQTSSNGLTGSQFSLNGDLKHRQMKENPPHEVKILRQRGILIMQQPCEFFLVERGLSIISR
ncbi:hypothetical protein ANTPLA_LOCUS5434 [Anthophora plagiata]